MKVPASCSALGKGLRFDHMARCENNRTRLEVLSSTSLGKAHRLDDLITWENNKTTLELSPSLPSLDTAIRLDHLTTCEHNTTTQKCASPWLDTDLRLDPIKDVGTTE